MLLRLKKVLKILCLLIIILLPCNLARAADTTIVSGYSYDDGGPHVVLYNIDKKEYSKQYLNGQKLHLIKTKTRYCVGTYNLVDFSSSPCPRRMLLDSFSKVNNCGECYKRIGFNPSFYNSSYISPQQLEYNKTPHVVYLAYFSPTCVKVGMASLKRSRLRLLEQGAKAAFILKTFPDAYQARELESKIAYGGFGILEGVTQKQKADILCTDRYNPDTALTVLKEYLKKIELVPESDFINLYSDYFYGKDVSFTYPDKTKLFLDSIVGEAVGMVGDIVIIKQQDRFFPITKFVFISIKNFISYQVK